MKSIKKSFQYGEHEVTIETGEIARQTDGAVLVSVADTAVLVTAVGRKEAAEGREFFPAEFTDYVDLQLEVTVKDSYFYYLAVRKQLFGPGNAINAVEKMCPPQ